MRSLVLAGLAAIGLSGPADDAPAFAPGPRAILTKAFSEDVALVLASFEVELDGQPLSQESPAVSIDLSRRVTLSDEYLEVRDGALRRFERTFDRLSAEARLEVEDEGVHEEHTVPGTSELADAVVLFEWDEGEERFRRSFEEGGTGVEAHLDALEPDADFLGFLPPGAVEVDATWDVAPDALGRAFAPGGDVRLLPSAGSEPYVELDLLEGLAASQLSLGEAESWSGRVGARYTGSGEEDGVPIGRIAIELDVEAEADPSERLREALARETAESSVEIQSIAIEWRLEGEGELLWNLDRGHVQGLLVEAALEVDVRLEWTQPGPDGRELRLAGRYGLQGTARLAMELE